MNKKPYSSAIKKTAFKYSFSKQIAQMMRNGMDRNEVFNECFNRNAIGIDSKQRRREVTNVIYERLSRLDEFLLEQFVLGDVETSKFILVYAIACNDSLFFDFTFEVYRDALLGTKDYISTDDLDIFFKTKRETDLIVRGWSEKTIEDLSCGYRNILVESGMGVRIKKNIKAVRMLVHPAVEEHLKLCEKSEYLQALLGE